MAWEYLTLSRYYDDKRGHVPNVWEIKPEPTPFTTYNGTLDEVLQVLAEQGWTPYRSHPNQNITLLRRPKEDE